MNFSSHIIDSKRAKACKHDWQYVYKDVNGKRVLVKQVCKKCQKEKEIKWAYEDQSQS